MNTRKTLLAAVLAGSLALPLAAYAERVYIDLAPPAPVYEQAPPRDGYVYTPGYWQYDEGRRNHVWVKGEYQAQRRGEHWVAHEWRQENGRYRFNEGRWEKDKGQ
jgi:WXXGXW repeat (2 copies)